MMIIHKTIRNVLAGTLIFASLGPALLADETRVIPVPTGEGRGGDASIMGGDKAALNFGTEQNLAIKSIDYSIKKAYLRFDLKGLDMDQQAAKATLVLTSANNHAKRQTIEVFGLLDDTASESWGEGSGGESTSAADGITYENAPGNAPRIGGGPSAADEDHGGVRSADAVLLGQFETSRTNDALSGDVFEFTSEELTAFVNDRKGRTATLILTAADRTNSQDVGVASKEHPHLPAPEIRLILR